MRERVRAVRGDMRRVRLKQQFDLVLATFNTALHLYEREDVERFLACVAAHLTPRGRFVVDLSMPHVADLARPAARAYNAPRFRHPTAGVVVKNREYFDYDPLRQVLFVAMEFEPVGDRARTWMTSARAQSSSFRASGRCFCTTTASGWSAWRGTSMAAR